MQYNAQLFNDIIESGTISRAEKSFEVHLRIQSEYDNRLTVPGLLSQHSCHERILLLPVSELTGIV
jgi:hypothetical protein